MPACHVACHAMSTLHKSTAAMESRNRIHHNTTSLPPRCHDLSLHNIMICSHRRLVFVYQVYNLLVLWSSDGPVRWVRDGARCCGTPWVERSECIWAHRGYEFDTRGSVILLVTYTLCHGRVFEVHVGIYLIERSFLLVFLDFISGIVRPLSS
jgi:hypothetical protein